jgi:ABC-2 type transport system ATP-binding protein
MPPTTPDAIQLEDLHKSFTTKAGPVRAVDGVELRITPGEVVALLGPNGAGKTTTLDMLLGLTTPTSGSVEIFGMRPQQAVRAGRVSAVLQSGGLLADLTVRETVRYVAATFRHVEPGAADVEEVMARAGVTDFGDRMVSKCSGGEQQRLRFALSLLPDPDLLVLDEPTAGMDVSARRDFWATMHADAASGRTVVFATHYLEEADDFADRIVLVADGRVVADGPTEQIRARATGRVVSATLPHADDGPLEVLRQTDGVGDVRRTELRVQVRTAGAQAADDVALRLLRDLGAHDLQVTTGSLEDAFVALTAAVR